MIQSLTCNGLVAGGFDLVCHGSLDKGQVRFDSTAGGSRIAGLDRRVDCAVLVKQLVHNLYSNAMKYNLPQGRIRFVLQNLGDALALTITNSTAQMSAELAEHAFDRFYRGDAARNRGVDGLGLGLSICQRLVTTYTPCAWMLS